MLSNEEKAMLDDVVNAWIPQQKDPQPIPASSSHEADKPQPETDIFNFLN